MKSIIIDLTCRSLPYDAHLVEGLEKAGVDVDLWIAGCLPEQQAKDRKQCVIDIARRAPGRLFRKAAKGAECIVNGLGLHRSLRNMEGPDIIHYQWLPFAETIPSIEMLNLKWAESSGAGIVYTVHDVLPHDTGEQHKETFEQIYQIPDALICHTESSKEKLVDGFSVPLDRISVIPHGPLSDEVSFIPQCEARDRLNLEQDTPFCLFFGRIRPYKGVEFLIDSWRQVKEREPLAHLMLAGQPQIGYQKMLTDKIAELNLEREIDTHFEFLSQEKLNLCIQAADVLVYPYRSITQSGALLTGLTTGKPIVATDVGGFSEMIQHEQTGILVEYGDEEQLSAELVHLLRDAEKRRQIGKAAQKMVEKKYSWDTIAHKTVKCYRSVTG